MTLTKQCPSLLKNDLYKTIAFLHSLLNNVLYQTMTFLRMTHIFRKEVIA